MSTIMRRNILSRLPGEMQAHANSLMDAVDRRVAVNNYIPIWYEGQYLTYFIDEIDVLYEMWESSLSYATRQPDEPEGWRKYTHASEWLTILQKHMQVVERLLQRYIQPCGPILAPQVGMVVMSRIRVEQTHFGLICEVGQEGRVSSIPADLSTTGLINIEFEKPGTRNGTYTFPLHMQTDLIFKPIPYGRSS